MMETDSEEVTKPGASSKKRIRTGKMSEVMKKMKLQSHEEGEPCKCKRLKCFDVVNSNDRKQILQYFNSLLSHNEQNSYLTGLISVIPVQRRRSRKPEMDAEYHQAHFAYKIRAKREDDLVEIPICFKAFLSIHGITKNKVEYIQKHLKNTGVSPKDMRGQHSSKHRKLKEYTFKHVYDHINSFKRRLSHYSLHDSKRMYLSEDLNIKKMFTMFREGKPDIKLSYETYREIFHTKFNISFGYPRTDTCSYCDETNAKIKCLQTQKNNEAELKKLNIDLELHKRKAQFFYDRKRNARIKAKNNPEFCSVAMDFQKNVSLPNVPTNDVYYLRQLSMFSFNVHVLHSGQSIFYTYSEAIANKGSDEVASFLFHFITNYLDRNVKHLTIFCDSCGGQNKNYTLFRLIHYIVHQTKLLESIHINFPVRGHSYMECDKNMGLINLKTRMELPSDWASLLKASRTNPSPFEVIDVPQDLVKQWTKFLEKKYFSKCPFPIQPIKEIKTTKEHPRLMSHRSSFNGLWEQNAITPSRQNLPTPSFLSDNEFELPNPLYKDLIPLSDEKYDNIMQLKRYCDNPNADIFYSLLPHMPLKDKKKLKKGMKTINRKIPAKEKQEAQKKVEPTKKTQETRKTKTQSKKNNR